MLIAELGVITPFKPLVNTSILIILEELAEVVLMREDRILSVSPIDRYSSRKSCVVQPLGLLEAFSHALTSIEESRPLTLRS